MSQFEDGLLLLLALFLVALNGFFVGAEFGLVKLRMSRAEEMKDAHGLPGRVMYRVRTHLDAYLSACQLGITLSSLGLGWIGEPAFARLLEPVFLGLGIDSPELRHTIAFIIAFGLISYLHIVLGELAPKSLALRKPEQMSLWTALPLYLFYWLMYPFIWGLNASANWVLRRAGFGEPGGHHEEYNLSLSELQTILHVSHARSEDHDEDSELKAWLNHTLELADLEVSDLMRPLQDLAVIHSDDEPAAVRRLIQKYGYSRYPYRATEDEAILGILHVKELLLEPPGEDYHLRLRAQLREPLYVAESLAADSLLGQFRSGRPHLALVHDDEGQLSGFITMEDVLEAVFGEITDEHEQGRIRSGARRLVRLPDGSLLVSGDFPLFRLARELGLRIPEDEDSSSVGGMVMQRLDRIPQEGDRVRFTGFSAQVRRTEGPRVKLVKISREDRSAPA
ncbi:MAG TPA: hemolysin family protein [Nevskiaceae bacterium]|nr:hemolysin family protein [Nevskiaceae bacterium]